MNKKVLMKFLNQHLFFFSITVISGLGTMNAQEKNTVLPKANEEYAESKYADAEANYRISNSKFNNKTISNYNLGNAIYKQNQPSEAKFAYIKAIENNKSKEQKHKALFNLGNVYMKEKDYLQAVEAYKNALRNNPNDEEARYNLALAKKMLKDNPSNNNNTEGPSEYAKMMKKKADLALKNNNFGEALDIMNEALQNDKTTKNYEDYMKKLEDVVKIIKS
ncbi:MAG: hypothetical protein QG594_2112 [Bacteroidota bacterium]|nr:hypothetical protein [Bacteroidota bacterium]